METFAYRLHVSHSKWYVLFTKKVRFASQCCFSFTHTDSHEDSDLPREHSSHVSTAKHVIYHNVTTRGTNFSSEL